MNDKLISRIQGFTLQARHDLEREVGEQLEGIYGWLPDGSFAQARLYPALRDIEEARETRRRLVSYAAQEEEAGRTPSAARRRLVREAAFTWLNRLVALRMMEDRRLLKSAVSRLAESSAYIFWLTDDKDPEAYGLHDQGETPVNAMGEGPRHVAYRRFLLWQCGELAREVSVLFDPETLASRLSPRPTVLKALVAATNAEPLAEAWQPGNEETVGWIYEGFIEEENRAVFEKFGKGQKVTADEIGAATQRFTPRWIVRFLVENSLGRLWTEMHPDSRLKASLRYLVPRSNDVPTKNVASGVPPDVSDGHGGAFGPIRNVASGVPPASTLKPVRDITFLDPACGSMHFGLVAFDLFADMYREELENAGKPGWPEGPSVDRPCDIAAAIVERNLFGIDIDLRAVQVSALTLFLKAHTLETACAFTDRNLACCNVEEISGGRLDGIMAQVRFDHPAQERVLRSMSSRMRNSDQLGSLLRLETELESLVVQERSKAKENLQLLPGVSEEPFQSEAGMETFFSRLTEETMERLDQSIRATRAAGRDPGHLVREAAKGLRYLRLVSRRYDVVATNPPYMSRRNMSQVIAAHMNDQFPDAKGDLFAGFISRCVELAGQRGMVAMVTQQSFMFISSYEGLRERLRETIAIRCMAHLGPKAFANITGEKVNTTAFVVQREPDETLRDRSAGVYFRLVHERDAEAKRAVFEVALSALRAGEPHPRVFRSCQGDFDAIPGRPWVYWMPQGLRELFQEFELIEHVAKPRVGLQTADNTRFLRKWWEVGKGTIGFGYEDCAHAKRSAKRWFPYMKGGTPSAWFGNQVHVVDWNNNGAEIYAFRPAAVVRNPDYYFRRGVTWSDVSSKGFAARLSPGGFIHDVTGMTCFPREENIPLILGLLNSRIAQYLLAAINPTIHYQVGDIERLPVPGERSDRIEALVNECVELARQDSRDSEITYDFLRPLQSLDDLAARKKTLAEKEAEIDREVSRLYGLTVEDIEAIGLELAGAGAVPEEEDSPAETDDGEEESVVSSLTPEQWAQSWISYALGIVLGRFQAGEPGGLGCGDFSAHVVSDLKGLAAGDGILANDSGQPLDLAARVWRALVGMLGEAEAAARVGAALGNGDPVEQLRGWFDRFTGQPRASFWKYHFQLYRKRPVYWPLQSPKRQYTVWVFHERFSGDTLFHIRNNMVEPRLRLAERAIADLKPRAEKDRSARKELDRLLGFRDDLGEFTKRLKAVADRGYRPHIDDGVLLNAAPLFELLPSWPETRRAWEQLEAGEFDWAHQAMEYWPDRVREKCRANRSYAIAHGLEEICTTETGKGPAGARRRKRK